MPISPQTRSRLWAAVAAAYWCLLLGMTHYPDAKALTPDVLEETAADKVFHGGAFAGLAILLALAAAARFESRNVARAAATRSACFVALATALVYAVIDEVTQPLVNRTYETSDLVLDAIGSVCGVLIFRALRRFGDR